MWRLVQLNSILSKQTNKQPSAIRSERYYWCRCTLPGTTPLEVAVLKGHTAIADLGEETVRQNQQDPRETCSSTALSDAHFLYYKVVVFCLFF